MHETDSELMRRVRAGDRQVFSAIVERYADDLYGVAWSMLRNNADAEDVVQQSLMGAFKRIDLFEGRSSLKTWLISIVMNQASKAIRSKQVRRSVSLEADAVGPENISTDISGRGGSSGAASSMTLSPTASVDSRMDLMEMIRNLSPDHREVIVLRELQSMSYDEIAAALGIPRGTVESRLFRARRELRERFKEYAS